jgi:hypothetical protein
MKNEKLIKKKLTYPLIIAVSKKEKINKSYLKEAELRTKGPKKK